MIKLKEEQLLLFAQYCDEQSDRLHKLLTKERDHGNILQVWILEDGVKAYAEVAYLIRKDLVESGQISSF